MLHNTLVNRVKAQLIDLETNYLTTLRYQLSFPNRVNAIAVLIELILLIQCQSEPLCILRPIYPQVDYGLGWPKKMHSKA